MFLCCLSVALETPETCLYAVVARWAEHVSEVIRWAASALALIRLRLYRGHEPVAFCVVASVACLDVLRQLASPDASPAVLSSLSIG